MFGSSEIRLVENIQQGKGFLVVQQLETHWIMD